MKIAICARGPDLTCETDPRMGRCAWFIIVDPETGEHESLENHCAAEQSGAGVKALQVLREHNVSAVVAGSIGPHATRAMLAAGIEGYAGVSGTVADVIKQFQSGQLKLVEDQA